MTFKPLSTGQLSSLWTRFAYANQYGDSQKIEACAEEIFDALVAANSVLELLDSKESRDLSGQELRELQFQSSIRSDVRSLHTSWVCEELMRRRLQATEPQALGAGAKLFKYTGMDNKSVLLCQYTLKYDGLRKASWYTAVGPEGRLGEDKESLSAAVDEIYEHFLKELGRE